MLVANPDTIVDSAVARQLPALIAEWEAAADERHDFARALRLDLALLTERPELALVCLAWRCRQGPEMYVTPPRVPAWSARASQLAEGWLAASAPRHLHAVRPPPVPLHAGAVEEYRTDLRGELCVSRDGRQLGIVGEDDTISWERVSGRRTDTLAGAAASGGWTPLVPREPSARWHVATSRDPSSGVDLRVPNAIALDGGAPLELGLGSHEIAAVHVLDAAHVIVDCADFDDQHFFLVEVPAGRIAWTAGGECRAAIRHGRDVICTTLRGIEIRDLETGAPRVAWPCPSSEQLAVIPDSGAVVTRSGAVIRVWAERPDGAELAGTDGYLDAQFTPRGDRVISGGNLCDGRDGRLVARLDVTGPGWLEGGPPHPCQAIVQGAVVQVAPMGACIWRASDGVALVENDRETRARYDDQVAFDPQGRWYAVYHHAVGELRVHAIAGAPVPSPQALRLARAPSLGFTASGEELWWHRNDGRRFLLRLPSRTAARELAPDEPTPVAPAPRTHTVKDGVLEIGELAAPCDDASAVESPDGGAFASRRCHLVIQS